MKQPYLSQTKASPLPHAMHTVLTAKPEMHPLLQFQANIGNRAVNQLIAAQHRGDRAEVLQPSDRLLTPQASVISSPNHQLVQTKSMFRGLSCELTHELQQREVVSPPQQIGKRLPETVQQKMETAFNTDFSDVRIHEGREAESIGAIAYTRGSDIHFAPGQYSPMSQTGQQLLGHELTHVVQQRNGQVTAPQGKGAPINADPTLEHEADQGGMKAARGEQVASNKSKTVQRRARNHPIQRVESGGAAVKKKPLYKRLWKHVKKKFSTTHHDQNQATLTEAHEREEQPPDQADILEAENYKIQFLVKKLATEEATEILRGWLETVEAAISKSDVLSPEIQGRLEASQRILKSMLEMLHQDDNPDRQVWQTVVNTDRSIESAQAIAIISAYGAETIVNYVATAPVNIYGTREGEVRGAGTSLMVAAIRKAKENKSPVRLHADADAVRFYQNMGFVITKDLGGDKEMELTQDKFDAAEDYLRKKGIRVNASDILKALKNRDFFKGFDWDHLS